MINIRKIISVLITASICASNVAAFAEVPDKQTVQEYFASKNEDERETSEIIVSYSDEIQTNDMSRSAKIVNAEVEKVISENTVLLKTNDIEGTLETLKENESVVYAQPNYRLYTASDDILNDKLWAMENKGQIINGTQGSENADLNILKAWEITKGSEEVVVAVLDTGIDINHPALSGNIWTNSNEQTNGADSDNNGYADDVNGWDFVNNDSSVFDNAAVDGHGTHMAGIIAADGQNGVYGVAPNVKIMPLKVMEANSGYTSDIIEAIEYAEANGAKIVNCSFAGLEYNPALEDAISKSSMLFVTAAGNYSSSTDDLVAFPACYDCKNIISVGAVDNNGNIAELSSYGDLINVYAPGTGIYSTLPDNEYDFMNGTSCSAAYVTGIAALLYSEYPELTVKQAKEAICSKSDSSESGIQLMSTSAEMLDAKEILDFDILNAKSSMPEIIDLTDDITEREEKYPFSFFDESGVKFSLNVAGISDGSLSISAADNEYAEEIFYIEISDDNRYVDIQNIANDTEYDFWLTYTQDNIRHNYYGKLKKSYIEDENKYLTESYGIVANNYEIGIALLSNVEERESNDTMQFADTINSDDDVYGAISSLSDVDWYKITFSSSGVANFWLGDVPFDCNYQLELYNASGSRLTGSYNAAGKQELISFYSVSASTYYIKIYSANGYSSSKYRFRAKWYPSPDSYESNDSFASSSTLGNNSYKYANINHPDDVDFYKFTLTQKSYVELKLSNIPSGSRYNMEIYNGAGKNYFMSGNYTSGTSKQFLQILESGTYYVKIYSYDGAYSEDEYKIFLNSGIAYSMSLSGNTSGSIGTSVIAAYTFSAPSKRGVKINLSGVSSSDFDLFLYELSSGTLTKIASGESDSKTDESVSATLPGGDYVLIVKRCNGSETSFTLSALQTTTSKQAEITLSGFPTTMNTGDSKAITVKVTNNGINEWTRADGYKLGGLYDVASFADSEFLLTSTEKIQYGKSKTFRFNLTAPAISNMQDYTLAFKMKQNGTYFNYVSDHQVINVMANVDSISPGSTKSISGVTAKYYKLTVSSGANYAFRTMYKGTKCDTELYLYDSAMNLIESNDDIYDRKVYKQNYYSKIERYLSSGTYYICVKEHSGSTVQCCLNVDTYAEDNLSASDNVINKYEGYYRYTVSTAGTYVFATKKYAADCDTYLILTDLNGVVLESNNDSGSSVYAKIETELSKGTYYLRVSSYKYIAKGEDAKTNCTLTAGLKSAAPPTGDSASISISSPSAAGVIKTYTGNSIKISGNAANCSGVTVKVNNKTLSGVKLNGSRYEVYYTPTESGKYTILVTGNAIFGSNPSVSRTVTIAVNDDSDNFNSTPTAINSGTERVAAIDYVDDVDCFSFTPKETGSYKIYSSGSVDLKAILYENDKTTSIGTSYNAPESINFKLARTLEKNKTYYIRVDAEKHGVTGKYTINIEKIDEPNDTHFEAQWGLCNKGEFTIDEYTYLSKVGCDINVLPVWEYTKGDGITVAVIDTGVDYSHNDLKDNLILPGKNTVHGNTDIFPENEADVYDKNGNVINTSARYGHGTHVSGIISADGDNKLGISGVAPKANILPIKSLGNSLEGSEEARNLSRNEKILDGIEYAISHNANIVNMSFGGNAYDAMIEQTISNAKDVLFVASAGNDRKNIGVLDPDYKIYPAMYDCDNLITVAAINGNKELCSFSNYGGTTDIAAPGENIISTISDNGYDFCSGTSGAAPMASGVAALIWSYYPNLTAIQLKNRIVSANNVSYDNALHGKVSSNGYLNAWYAFSSDSAIPRKISDIKENNEYDEILETKRIISAIKSQKDTSMKTTEIFVKAMQDDKCLSIVDEVLKNFKYDVVKQYKISGAYFLRFTTIEDADTAVNILNTRNDIKFAEPNYIVEIN